jgi:hypothetical protein
MDQSAYEIIGGNSNQAYAKPNETALHSKTVVDASSLGQIADAIKRHYPPRKAGIDADRIDDLILSASQRKPPSSPLQSPSAPLTAALPSMAPGIGGFNIDAPIQKARLAPIQKARLAKGDIAVAHMPPPASPRPNLVSQPPLQAQRMAEIVESGESSLMTRLVAIVAIAAFAGLMLFVFRDETGNKLSDILPTIAPFCKVSGAETSAYQTDMAAAWRPFGFVGR